MSDGEWEKVSRRSHSSRIARAAAPESLHDRTPHLPGSPAHGASFAGADGHRRRLQVSLDLSSFKTLQCPRSDYHDHKKCCYFHSESDRRRDPYCNPYSPSDPGVSVVERVYHPLTFRTKLCTNPSACAFGEFCAFAHSDEDLLQLSGTYEEAIDSLYHPPKPDLPLVYDCYVAASREASEVSAPDTYPPYAWLADAEVAVPSMNRLTVSTSIQNLQLLPWQAALVQEKSSRLLAAIKRSAEEHLCAVTIAKQRHGDRASCLLQIHGSNAAQAKDAVARLLCRPPAEVAWLSEREYIPRVFEKIVEILDDQTRRATLGGSKVHIFTVPEDSTLIVCSHPAHASKGQAAMEKIDFWLMAEEQMYGQVHQCMGCFEERNADEGAMCPHQHFFCSVNGCFIGMAVAQIPSIRFQEGKLRCTCCTDAIYFPEQTVAAHLTKEIYEQVLAAKVEARVSVRYAEFQEQFDERLKQAVHELEMKYTGMSATDPMKIEAERLAAQARNEVLNLSCPNCSAVYAEFDGCMALECGSCHRFFCGYCHQGGFKDGRGAHQHVRECDENLTTAGSYYADSTQIRKAQIRYRIKALKKFLRKFKKNVQNAVVFELERDIADLGIDKGALLSVGDLI